MKNPNLKDIPFINPKDLKKSQCEKCKGQGNIKGKKCDICGGSGSKNNINILQNFVSIEKGKPQKKYEIIIRDIEEDKIMYKNAGYGGVLATIEHLRNFSGKEVEGDFQSAMWGNPLVQRFGIDRLEEQFIKGIEEYVDAMEQAGMFFSDRDKLKKILIEGNILKLQKVMGIEINKINKPNTTANPHFEQTDDMSERNKTHAINKVSEILNRDNSYAFLIVERKGKGATIDTIAKGFGPKDIVMSAMESAVNMFAHKEKKNFSDLQKAELAMSLLKELAKDILNKYKPNN